MHYRDLERFVLRQPRNGPISLERIKRARAIVDGYPRSGNTFASEIAQFILSKACKITFSEEVIHHFHGDMIVDIALKYNVPSVFVIRQPIDAIISCCLFRLSEAGIGIKDLDNIAEKDNRRCVDPAALRFLIEKECLQYLMLYTKTIMAWESISSYTRIISFDDFKDNPYHVVDALFSAMELKMETIHNDATLMDILKDKNYFLDIISNNAKKAGRDLHQISAPRSSTDAAKEVLRECIRMQQLDLIQRARDVYDEIVDSSGIFMKAMQRK